MVMVIVMVAVIMMMITIWDFLMLLMTFLVGDALTLLSPKVGSRTKTTTLGTCLLNLAEFAPLSEKIVQRTTKLQFFHPNIDVSCKSPATLVVNNPALSIHHSYVSHVYMYAICT